MRYTVVHSDMMREESSARNKQRSFYWSLNYTSFTTAVPGTTLIGTGRPEVRRLDRISDYQYSKPNIILQYTNFSPIKVV